MFKSLKSKLTIPSVGILVLVVLGIVIYSSNSANTLADDLIWKRVVSSSRAVDSHISHLEAQTNIVAYAAAGDYLILSAISEWNAGNNRQENRGIIINRLRELTISMGVDSFTVRDFEGRTIVRLHDLGFYYDIDGLPNAVNALVHRQTTTSFTSTAAMPMSLITTIPIIFEGEVIGTMASVFHFNIESFVDNLTHVFDAPVSVYRGREAIATSLMINGRRGTGFEVTNAIADIVIEQGVSHMAEHSINGESTISYYMPFFGAAGNVIGMMAIHFSTRDAEATTFTMVRTLIIIGVAGAIVAAFIMFFIITRTLKPVGILTRQVKEVASGNFNININRNKIPEDEIGAMTLDIYSLVDIIKSLVDDLSETYNEYIKQGNIRYNIDAGKYQNSYKEMVGLVNNLLTTVTVDLEEVAVAMNRISEGNFDKEIDINAWKGDWIFIPNALNSLTNCIKSVSSEVNKMIMYVSEHGDVSYKADVARYQGEWRKIMDGLNRIMKAVNEPLHAISIGMLEMQKGNLDLEKINNMIISNGYDPNPEDYNGIFRDTISAFDSTATNVSSYINELEKILSLMAAGDLRNKINREYVGSFDLIKSSVNNINDTLHKTLSEISTAAEQVLSGANQISNSALELASGAQEQANSVQKLNTAIDSINHQTRQNADNAQSANELSQNSASDANEGNIAMKQTVDAMEQIKKSSDDISKIIKTIQDIAFQTNLLALNASVEAARAGEHGMGFAVVANEVRTLAGRSQDAANETTELISNSIEKVQTGSAIALTSSKSLDGIVASSGEVSELIKGISAASLEQADAIEQVSEGLDEISKVTQTNSAVSEEAAAASEELNSQAEVLKQLVSFFKL